ncbi:MAG: response regulator [Methylococcales bacterium]|nr:response regulator [Methylococcales bacterium]MBT7410525.1 response regulator [Methylococcales bacterium]
MYSELSPLPIAEIDTQGVMHYSNPAMIKLLVDYGYNELGYPNIFPENYIGIITQSLFNEQAIENIENHFQSSWFVWNFHPLDDNNLILCYGVDVTTQKIAELHIKEAKEKIEEASHAKSNFIANMSHELRTPLNAIMGFSELMTFPAKAQGRSEDVEALGRITSAGHYLLSLIGNILDISKIEAGQMELDEIAFPLKVTLDKTINLLNVKAHEKFLDLKLDYQADLTRQVIGDPKVLSQIIINLTGNAIKFTAKGGITISVKETIQDENALLNFAVKDTGAGIAKEKIESVFEKFIQESTSTSRVYGGTGLGLSITKEFIEMMDGKIGATSQLGQGSTFWFDLTLPISKDQQVLMIEPDPEKLENACFDFSVLLADDEIANQLVGKGMLEKTGCRVELAANGLEVLEKIKTQTYDVIFMDCQMPELDGYETSSKIREMEQNLSAHQPIIAMTANVMKGDREKCINAGMDDYIAKPVSIDTLKATLNRLFQSTNCLKL